MTIEVPVRTRLHVFLIAAAITVLGVTGSVTPAAGDAPAADLGVTESAPDPLAPAEADADLTNAIDYFALFPQEVDDATAAGVDSIPDAGAEELVLSAVPDTDGAAAAGSKTTTCTGGNSGGKAYDYPHPASSTSKTTINAHLSIVCTDSVASIHLESMMCHANFDQCGTATKDTAFVTRSFRIGGDMACGATARKFVAVGYIKVTLPPGYTPQTQSANAKSVTKRFVKQGGICVTAS